MASIDSSKKIILFDGVCNLCNHTVQFVIKHDTEDVFRFAALQSALGQRLMAEHHIDTAQLSSIVLIEPGKACYMKSSAALRIAKHLKSYRWMRLFLGLPKGLRDAVYMLIANNRYRWFGKKDSCMMPTPQLSAKFLSDEIS